MTLDGNTFSFTFEVPTDPDVYEILLGAPQPQPEFSLTYTTVDHVPDIRAQRPTATGWRRWLPGNLRSARRWRVAEKEWRGQGRPMREVELMTYVPRVRLVDSEVES